MAGEPSAVGNDQNALVRYWTMLWVEGNGDQISEVLADPFVTHSSEGTIHRTPADQAAHVLSITEHLRGTQVEFHLLDAIADRLHARFTLRGVNLRSGHPVTVGSLAQYRLVDGRLAESWATHTTGLEWR